MFRSNRPRFLWVAVAVLIALVCIGAFFVNWDDISERLHRHGNPASVSPETTLPSVAPATVPDHAAPPENPGVPSAAEPKGESKGESKGKPGGEPGAPPNTPEEEHSAEGKALPPSPPLPCVPAGASQVERKKAFNLQSLDLIVGRDEPFSVSGRQITIAEMQNRKSATEDPTPIITPFQERDFGSKIRRPVIEPPRPPIPMPVYYGVRIVRPGEYVWGIDFAVLRQVMARRGVMISTTADHPDREGRSSGVARILKFAEGIVYAYNVHENRFEKDLNTISPGFIVIYFRICDYVAALDRLNTADLQGLHYYVKGFLELDQPEQDIRLLDKRTFGE